MDKDDRAKATVLIRRFFTQLTTGNAPGDFFRLMQYIYIYMSVCACACVFTRPIGCGRTSCQHQYCASNMTVPKVRGFLKIINKILASC